MAIFPLAEWRAKLYHQGYAKEIWLTHPGARSDPLRQFGVRYPSEDDCNYQVLRKQGIHAKAIHIFESSLLNTADELGMISAAAGRWQPIGHCRDGPTIHAARVHLWKEFEAARGSAIVHGVSHDYNPSRWWQTPAGTMPVLHEVLGMINASAELPVQTGIRQQRSAAENTSPDSQAQRPQPLKIQQPVDSD